MFKFFRDLVRGIQLPKSFGILLGNDDLPDHTEQDASLYSRDILQILQTLNEERSEAEIRDALSNIGHAIYFGGPQSAVVGLDILPRLVGVLCSPLSSTALKIQALKSMSEVCSQFRDYQVKIADLGALPLLVNMATESRNTELSNWAYHCLTVLIANNAPLMRELLKMDDLSERVKRSMYDRHSKGEKVYAKLLLKLLDLDH